MQGEGHRAARESSHGHRSHPHLQPVDLQLAHQPAAEAHGHHIRIRRPGAVHGSGDLPWTGDPDLLKADFTDAVPDGTLFTRALHKGTLQGHIVSSSKDWCASQVIICHMRVSSGCKALHGWTCIRLGSDMVDTIAKIVSHCSLASRSSSGLCVVPLASMYKAHPCRAEQQCLILFLVEAVGSCRDRTGVHMSAPGCHTHRQPSHCTHAIIAQP